MKTHPRNTHLHYKDATITDGRIILVDENLSGDAENAIAALETANGEETLFLRDEDLAGGLEEILSGLVGSCKNPMFVFPGNGSNFPRKLSRTCQTARSCSVYAQRLWTPGNDPVVSVGQMQNEAFLDLRTEAVIVIDDVISSGMTMQMIRERNAWKFPRAKWIGVAWAAQLPQNKCPSGIQGYDEVFASMLVGRPSGLRVPVNSLSTFRANAEIAQSYAQRHFKDPEAFIRLLV